jgi:hypothetical protein
MNLTTFVKCIVILSVSVLLAACRKFDFRNGITARHCHIDVFTGNIDTATWHRKFHYNEHGNPTLVEYVEMPDGTGTPSFYFHYNDKQQLIRVLGYDNHRYFYNDLGQIVTDSINVFYTGGDARYETKFSYDLWGRVIKTTTKYYYNMFDQEGVGETTTRLFKYDQRGNLVIPGVTYDHRTSIFRTHPLWMFLNLNYSINNPVKATSYNTAGLPLTFGDHDINFLESSMFLRSVEYDCGEAVK